MLNATVLSGSSHVEARAKTMYNKNPGVLTFTNTRIQWIRDGENRPTVNVAHSKITSKKFNDSMSKRARYLSSVFRPFLH
jgi:TFIIH p62 subunit, N-terminal domain